MAAALALHTKIHADPQDLPALTAAGVPLFQFQHVADLDVHAAPSLLRFQSQRRESISTIVMRTEQSRKP